MTQNSRRLFTIAVTLLLLAFIAVDANAQCCGATTAYYPQAYSSYYAPAYTSYYAPAYTSNYAPAYTSYYAGGWYPGYWMDRARVRLWGSPSTYVTASYPNSYYAGYRPTYYAGYGGYATSYVPASSCSTCSSCSAGYAPCSTCAAYAPCTTCASPCGCDSCGSSCQSCSGCSSCSAPVATQASYQPQSSCGCSSCGNSAQTMNTPQNTGAPAPQQTLNSPSAAEPPPFLPNQQGSPQSVITNRPTDNTTTPSHPEYNEVKKSDNSTYLEAPKLFSPKDRTAQRSIAPVRTALYDKPVSFHQVSTAPTTITAEQAQKDAIGWTSASN